MSGDRLKDDAGALRALEDKIAALTEQLADLDPAGKRYRTVYDDRAYWMRHRRIMIDKQTAVACSR